MRKSRHSIFLDTSVIVSGFRSKTGASSYILSLCQKGKLKGVISDLVIREIIVNLKAKAGSEALIEFYQLLAGDVFTVVNIDHEEELKRFSGITHDKDVHVLAGCQKAGADFLISLDKKHILTPVVAKALHPIKVVTPGDFLKYYFSL